MPLQLPHSLRAPFLRTMIKGLCSGHRVDLQESIKTSGSVDGFKHFSYYKSRGLVLSHSYQKIYFKLLQLLLEAVSKCQCLKTMVGLSLEMKEMVGQFICSKTPESSRANIQDNFLKSRCSFCFYPKAVSFGSLSPCQLFGVTVQLPQVARIDCCLSTFSLPSVDRRLYFLVLRQMHSCTYLTVLVPKARPFGFVRGFQDVQVKIASSLFKVTSVVGGPIIALFSKMI